MHFVIDLDQHLEYNHDYKAKDTVDVNINDDLADAVNGFFREGISDEKYSEIMKSN
jgi:hypothetical protein